MKTLFLALALTMLAHAQEPLLEIGKWLPQGVANVRVTVDGQRLLVMPHYYDDSGRNLELWSVPDGKRLAELYPAAQHISAVFTPGGLRVAAIIEKPDARGWYASRAYLWDLQGQLQGNPLDLAGDLAEQQFGENLLLTHWENKEKGNENGGTRWAEGQVRSWHWPTGKIRTLGKVRSRLERAQVSNDGHWVATLGGDAALRLWDARLGGMKSQRYNVSDFAFSSDPDTLIVDGKACRLPSLTAGRSLPKKPRFVAGKLLYQLNPPQILDGRTFQPISKARLQAAPGFSPANARPAGVLTKNRLLLWDSQNHTSAILSP